MNDEASTAIRIYLGAGPSGGYQPIGQQERLKKAFPNDHEQMLMRIRKYLEEDHPPAAWSSSDLAQEQRTFEALLAKKIPELDSVAIISHVRKVRREKRAALRIGLTCQKVCTGLPGDR